MKAHVGVRLCGMFSIIAGLTGFVGAGGVLLLSVVGHLSGFGPMGFGADEFNFVPESSTVALAGVSAAVSGVFLLKSSEGPLAAIVSLALVVVFSLSFCVVVGWAELKWLLLPVGLVVLLAIVETFYLATFLRE